MSFADSDGLNKIRAVVQRAADTSIIMTDAEGSSMRSWNNADTKDCRLRVVNSSNLVVDVTWVQHSGTETSYRKLQPGGVHLQGAEP